jgi:hypothetical protein
MSDNFFIFESLFPNLAAPPPFLSVFACNAVLRLQQRSKTTPIKIKLIFGVAISRNSLPSKSSYAGQATEGFDRQIFFAHLPSSICRFQTWVDANKLGAGGDARAN